MGDAAYSALLTQTVTVKAPTVALTQFGNPKTADYEDTGTDIDGLIQLAGTDGESHEMFNRWPTASAVLFCETTVTIDMGYLVEWTDGVGSKQALVMAPPEDAGGQDHHFEVPLQVTKVAP